MIANATLVQARRWLHFWKKHEATRIVKIIWEIKEMQVHDDRRPYTVPNGDMITLDETDGLSEAFNLFTFTTMIHVKDMSKQYNLQVLSHRPNTVCCCVGQRMQVVHGTINWSWKREIDVKVAKNAKLQLSLG